MDRDLAFSIYADPSQESGHEGNIRARQYKLLSRTSIQGTTGNDSCSLDDDNSTTHWETNSWDHSVYTEEESKYTDDDEFIGKATLNHRDTGARSQDPFRNSPTRDPSSPYLPEDYFTKDREGSGNEQYGWLEGDCAPYDDDRQPAYPFSSCESAHSPTRFSSIRERNRMEIEKELIKKEREELAHLRVKIRPKPVPISTLMPKYPEMVEVAQAKALGRKLESAMRLEQTISPFKRMERYTADKNQQHATQHGQQHGLKTENRAAERKKPNESQDERAQRLLRASHLPRALEEHQRRSYQREQMRAKRVAKERAKVYTFKPKITAQVPDFQMCQARWAYTLSSARQDIRTTRPDVSDLSMFSEEVQLRRNQRKSQQRNSTKHEHEKREDSLRQTPHRKPKRFTQPHSKVYMTHTTQLRILQAAKKREQDQLARTKQRQVEKAKANQKQQRDTAINADIAQVTHAARTVTPHVQRKAPSCRVKQPRKPRVSLMERDAEARRRAERRMTALNRVAASLAPTSGLHSVLSPNEEQQVVESFQLLSASNK